MRVPMGERTRVTPIAWFGQLLLYGLFAVVQGLLGALTLLHSPRDPGAIRPPPPNAGEDDA